MPPDVKLIRADDSPDKLIEVVNRHQVEVVGLKEKVESGERTTAELRETIGRMIPDTSRLLDRANRSERLVEVPTGSAHELDAMFLREDGSVRFGDEKIRLINPQTGDLDLEWTAPGLFTSRSSVCPEHQKVRAAYTAVAILRALNIKATRSNAEGFGSEYMRRALYAFESAMRGLPGRVGEFCRSMYRDPNVFKRVISKTSGSGGELLAVPTLGVIKRPTDLSRRIVSLIRSENAPSQSFKKPVVTGRALGHRRGATADDPQRYPRNNFTTSDETITLVDWDIMALLDDRWGRDAGMVIGDPIGFVNDWLMSGVADTLEIAFLHADTNNQDTLSTLTFGGMYTAGDLATTDSVMKWWLGFRARGFDDSNSASGGGTFSATVHLAAINRLGNLNDRGVAAITGLPCFYEQILGMANFLTVDKFGPQATIVTGQLGSIMGTPLVISQFMPKIFDTSSGLITGSNAGNEIVYTATESYSYWENTNSDSWDVRYPERGAQYIGMTASSILSPDCISTEKPVSIVYNL